jgi:multidrug resistance efflux pump
LFTIDNNDYKTKIDEAAATLAAEGNFEFQKQIQGVF